MFNLSLHGDENVIYFFIPQNPIWRTNISLRFIFAVQSSVNSSNLQRLAGATAKRKGKNSYVLNFTAQRQRLFSGSVVSSTRAVIWALIWRVARRLTGEGGAHHSASLHRWRRWWTLGRSPQRTSTSPVSMWTGLSREAAMRKGLR